MAIKQQFELQQQTVKIVNLIWLAMTFIWFTSENNFNLLEKILNQNLHHRNQTDPHSSLWSQLLSYSSTSAYGESIHEWSLFLLSNEHHFLIQQCFQNKACCCLSRMVWSYHHVPERKESCHLLIQFILNTIIYRDGLISVSSFLDPIC